MPLVDEMGRPARERRISVEADIREVVVEHDEVRFHDGAGNVLFLVCRPTYPGAGMAVEFAEEILRPDPDGGEDPPFDPFELEDSCDEDD